ncbi:DUF6941 family protein [Desulfotruncus arcticus]|uniref:DUF6941 family protein n=1 Tax=Desulfotruncus arcticus TaxID=341036 RepID=UPI003EB9D0D0
MEGVFYRVHPFFYPVKHKCFLVVGWCGTQGTYRFGLRLLAPGGRVTLEINDFQFSISRSSPYHNTIINAELLLPEEGIYNFEIFLEGEPAGRFPLHVITAPARIKQ